MYRWGCRWSAGRQNLPLLGKPAEKTCVSGWGWTVWWCVPASPPGRRSSGSGRCSFRSRKCWGTSRSTPGRWRTWNMKDDVRTLLCDQRTERHTLAHGIILDGDCSKMTESPVLRFWLLSKCLLLSCLLLCFMFLQSKQEQLEHFKRLFYQPVQNISNLM